MKSPSDDVTLSEEVQQLIVSLVRKDVEAKRNVSVKEIRLKCEDKLNISLIDQRSELREVVHMAAISDEESLGKLREAAQRKKKRILAVRIIQSMGRGCQVRITLQKTKIIQMKKSCLIIQTRWRGYLSRNDTKLLWRSATQIQSIFRSHASRQEHQTRQLKVSIIQQHWRDHHHRMSSYSKTIQRICRGYISRLSSSVIKPTKVLLLHRVFISYLIRLDVYQRYSYLHQLRLQLKSVQCLQRISNAFRERKAAAAILYKNRQNLARIVIGYGDRKILQMKKTKLFVLNRICVGYRERWWLWKETCDSKQRTIVRAWGSYKVRTTLQDAIRRSSSARLIQLNWRMRSTLLQERDRDSLVMIDIGDDDSTASAILQLPHSKHPNISTSNDVCSIRRSNSHRNRRKLKRSSSSNRRISKTTNRFNQQKKLITSIIEGLKEEQNILMSRKTGLEKEIIIERQPAEAEETRQAAALQVASNRLRMELVENARLRNKEKRIAEIQLLKDKITAAEEERDAYRQSIAEMRKSQAVLDKKLCELEDTEEKEIKNQRRMRGDSLVAEGCAKRTSDQIRLGKMTIRCQKERISRLSSQDHNPELSLANVIQAVVSRRKVENLSEELVSLQSEYDRLLHSQKVLNRRLQQASRSNSIQQSLQIELHKLTQDLDNSQHHNKYETPIWLELSPRPPPRKHSVAASESPCRVRYPSWLKPPTPKAAVCSQPKAPKNKSKPIWLRE